MSPITQNLIVPPWTQRDITRWQNGGLSQARDCIAQETPIVLSYNGESFAVMLATPQDVQDFAIGFSLSENIIGNANEIENFEIIEHPEGIEARMTISEARFNAMPRQDRAIAGRTGCGLCGVRSLEQAVRYPEPVGEGASITTTALHAALAALEKTQVINAQTGSVHAAAWATPDGKIQAVREDVGRHNALDKLIGHLARNGNDPATGFIIVTSRASYEMVQKAAHYGVGILVAVSAPTSLAVRMADMANMTLVGFARPNSHVIYTHTQRIVDVAMGVEKLTRRNPGGIPLPS